MRYRFACSVDEEEGSKMQCPKCYGEMAKVSDNPIRVDQCSECHGLYFAQLDRQILEEIGSDTEIDSGDESKGAEHNEMVYVDCPKCNKMMDQRLTDDPVHIRFELCTSCHSGFLDAGEFRQYMTEEYIEGFRALLPGE